jgi:hypothetical protein
MFDATGEYCGGMCINDPKKRNGLIFWPDGRLKTMKERGLSLTDEERKRAQDFVRRQGTGATAEPEKPVAQPVAHPEKPVAQPEFPVALPVASAELVASVASFVALKKEALSSSERSRLRRARLKAEKKNE